MDKSNLLRDKLPALGLGTYHLKGSTVKKIAQEAYEIGYRHFDSASYYDNEKELGEILRYFPRESFQITSKVWHDQMGYYNVLRSFDRSLNQLQLEQIDLFLIHWPHPPELVMESLEALKELEKLERLKFYGVSNFTIRHLEEALKSGFRISANQVECHPYFNQEKLLQFCDKNNISLIAYCPIARGKVFEDPLLKSLSEKYKKNPAQITLRWHLQRGVHPIPKTQQSHRLMDNFKIFDFNLSDDEIAQINKIKQNIRMIDHAWSHFNY